MDKATSTTTQPSAEAPSKLTLCLDASLRHGIEAERKRVAELTGFRPSRAAMGQALLKRGLQNKAGSAA